ncbi:hypothetical protein LU659_25775 [Pseudomonas monteilii]|uniref:DUF6602 domain-containing protein n=1 Tax=Pseudomonas monteilii TaxID=76759 RepID=UPI001E57944A|nr:DUF6602 domain-containing protein [Pseudomonas monteilii]MCE0980804.1 hypothetical protein [Pseudomonas monteilii]
MTEKKERKARITTSLKQEREDFAARQARTKEFLTDLAQRANKIRSKDKEFHGLEREFLNLQSRLLSDYETSKDIKHPRDVGTAREVLLRAFFLENKLIPKRYAISNTSVRVASTTGHLSNELDILFYSALDSFTLMQRQNVYEVLPVEYSYGAIQVKSKLTKKELKSSFENISSFKRLKRLKSQSFTFSSSDSKPQSDGFGIIFAYDTDMDWMDMVSELKKTHAFTVKARCQMQFSSCRKDIFYLVMGVSPAPTTPTSLSLMKSKFMDTLTIKITAFISCTISSLTY